MLRERIADRGILILDGAYGSILLLSAKTGKCPVSTRVESLCLSDPDRVLDLHTKYLEAGADIISTNSFNILNPEMLKEGLTDEIAAEAAKLARQTVDSIELAEDRSRPLVAGSIGPTEFNPGLISSQSTIPIDELENIYSQQIRVLLSAGADLILFETITSSAIAVCGLRAAEKVSQETGVAVPVWVSAAVDKGGAMIATGESFADFCKAIIKFDPVAIGLNCVSDIKAAKPILEKLRNDFDGCVSFHPSAGLPVEGVYPLDPDAFTAAIIPIAERELADIVGGCCGTTPLHIQTLAAAVAAL